MIPFFDLTSSPPHPFFSYASRQVLQVLLLHGVVLVREVNDGGINHLAPFSRDQLWRYINIFLPDHCRHGYASCAV
jgi:hypothetical protein